MQYWISMQPRLLIFFIFGFLIFASPVWAIEIYAHRGGAGLLPENTLAAVNASLQIGVDMIDVDIGLTQDNVVVAYHDLALNPDYTRSQTQQWLTQSGPAIKQLPLSALQQYNVGQTKPNTAYAALYPIQISLHDHVTIPTLENILTHMQQSGRSAGIQIEIKTNPDHPQSTQPETIVPALIAVIKKTQFTGAIEVHSFDWRNLVLLQKLAPEITTSYLSENAMLDHPDYRHWLADQDIKAMGISFPELIKQMGGRVWCPAFQDVTPDLLRTAHQLGLKVNVWTVDQPKDMLRMIELGVDGIITNRPDLLRGLLAAKGKLSNPNNACTASAGP